MRHEAGALDDFDLFGEVLPLKPFGPRPGLLPEVKTELTEVLAGRMLFVLDDRHRGVPAEGGSLRAT